MNAGRRAFQDPVECRFYGRGDFPAEELRDAFDVLKTYVDDSHLLRRLLKCRECGHLYFYEFYEEMNFNDGDDAQYTSWVPVDDEAGADFLSGLPVFGLIPYSAFLSDYPPEPGKAASARWVKK